MIQLVGFIHVSAGGIQIQHQRIVVFIVRKLIQRIQRSDMVVEIIIFGKLAVDLKQRNIAFLLLLSALYAAKHTGKPVVATLRQC